MVQCLQMSTMVESLFRSTQKFQTEEQGIRRRSARWLEVGELESCQVWTAQPEHVLSAWGPRLPHGSMILGITRQLPTVSAFKWNSPCAATIYLSVHFYLFLYRPSWEFYELCWLRIRIGTWDSGKYTGKHPWTRLGLSCFERVDNSFNFSHWSLSGIQAHEIICIFVEGLTDSQYISELHTIHHSMI